MDSELSHRGVFNKEHKYLCRTQRIILPSSSTSLDEGTGSGDASDSCPAGHHPSMLQALRSLLTNSLDIPPLLVSQNTPDTLPLMELSSSAAVPYSRVSSINRRQAMRTYPFGIRQGRIATASFVGWLPPTKPRILVGQFSAVQGYFAKALMRESVQRNPDERRQLEHMWPCGRPAGERYGMAKSVFALVDTTNACFQDRECSWRS